MARLICLFALVTVGCVTPYQPRGYLGGFVDEHLGRGEWLVQVGGNAYTARLTLIRYLHRRAREVCESEGFSGYELLDTETERRTNVAPRSYHAETRQDGDGSSTEIVEQPESASTKYMVSSRVRCKASEAQVAQ